MNYHASFLLDRSLTPGITITLEIELNWYSWFVHHPVAGCQLLNVPQYESAYWIHADRTLSGYQHRTWVAGGSSTYEIQDYSDYITVDLISVDEMMVLQDKYDFNILGFEMFNPETMETIGVFIWHGESIEQGLNSLEELGVEDLSGFRVFSIKLDYVPTEMYRSSTGTQKPEPEVLTIGRVHPNNDLWQNF